MAEYVFGAHAGAIDNAEAQKSKTWRPATGGAVPRVCAFVAAAPLFMDLTGTAAHFQSAPGFQGTTVAPTAPARPVDPPTLSSSIQPSLRATATLTGKLGAYLTTDIRPDDRPTVFLWDPFVAGRTPGIGVYQRQDPQPFDLLTVQPSTMPAKFNPQGPTIRQIGSAPEVRDLVLASSITASVARPIVIVTGPTIPPQVSSFAFPDLTVNYSATFTPSTFAPNLPPLGPVTVPSVIGMHWIPASQALIAAGLTQTQDPIQVFSRLPVPPGTVLSQSPAPGTGVQKNTDVVLTVSVSYLLSATFDVIPWYV